MIESKLRCPICRKEINIFMRGFHIELNSSCEKHQLVKNFLMPYNRKFGSTRTVVISDKS